MDTKRIFLIVLDSCGIGGAPDAADYGDAGSDTLAAISKSPKFSAVNTGRLGLFNITGVTCGAKEAAPTGAFARLREASKGKDTTVGHWEMAGVVSEKPMPTYPDGLPADMIAEFEKRSGKKTLCHKPYSGTDVIRDYGEEHMKTGALIVYTSADSVFQIAANEAVVPLEELYRYCEIARGMLQGDWGVGRVIARPFVGTDKTNFKRTTNRHDYSLAPPSATVLDALKAAGRDVIAVGKINDIFAGQGPTEVIKTTGNTDGMAKTAEIAKRDFNGLCFVNLVDFDMLYGHRNNVDGYAAAFAEFDAWLGDFLQDMRAGDLLLVTADHGCDPTTPSTDHSREDVPLLVAGAGVKAGADLGLRQSFACIANTVADCFGLAPDFPGQSLLPLFAKG